MDEKKGQNKEEKRQAYKWDEELDTAAEEVKKILEDEEKEQNGTS